MTPSLLEREATRFFILAKKGNDEHESDFEGWIKQGIRAGHADY